MKNKRMDRLNPYLQVFGLPAVLLFSIFYGTAYVDRTPVPACGVHVSRAECDEFKPEIFGETLMVDAVKVTVALVDGYTEHRNMALDSLIEWWGRR